MRKILPLMFLLLACASSNANAWFFFFLPGSVTGKIVDAFTGAEGENCVGESAKVGDNINANGQLMTIKSLSGTSTRCTNTAMPIRAMLEPSSTVVTQSTTQAKIDLPDGWESIPLNSAQKVDGAVLLALDKTIDSGLLLNTAKRQGITDMRAYADSRKAGQASRLQDAQQSETTKLMINGLPAWRFEVTGQYKNTSLTYSITIIEGDQEIVSVSVWSSAAGFPQQKEALLRIVDSLNGLPPPVGLVKEAEAKKKATEEEATNLAAEEEAKRLAAIDESKWIAAEEQAKRLATEEEAKRIKADASKKNDIRVPSKSTASNQVNFNAEANKAARILGCQPTELKVTGIDGVNIQYAIPCNDGKTLILACDQSGLCLTQ